MLEKFLTPAIIIPVIAGIFIAVLLVAGYLKAPPDTAYIISGLGKRRVLIGKAGWRVPFFERVDKISLRVMQVDGKTSELMGCSAAALLNALKELAGIDHKVHLISQTAIQPIQTLKVHHLGSSNPRLHTDEVLIALATSANTDPLAQRALEHLGQLKGCQAHCSVMLSPADSVTYKKLGLLLTCQPQYQTNKLYHK